MSGLVESTQPFNVAHLFGRATPHEPYLRAMLNGTMPSIAIMDSKILPTKAVITSHEGLCFASDGTDGVFVATSLDRVRRLGRAMLVLETATGKDLPVPRASLLRRQFHGGGEIKLHPTTALVADGVQRMTVDNLNDCPLWGSRIPALFGSSAEFIDRHFGFFLQVGGDVVAEAIAFVGGKSAELSVITAQSSWGKGYGGQVSFALALECLQRELLPYWSCNAESRASIAIARKLYLQDGGSYHIFLY